MSVIDALAPSRRRRHVEARVPVVLPLIEIDVDADGALMVAVDREPYDGGAVFVRDELPQLLARIVGEIGTVARVEVREADGTRFTDIVAPEQFAASGPVPAEAPIVAPRLGEVTGSGFLADEQVAVAVVVAHRSAAPDGTASLRLPPALLEAHPGLVVLLGQTSGRVTVSGGVG